jgi:poly(beta-D-mannuronate) C5 epimerase
MKARTAFALAMAVLANTGLGPAARSKAQTSLCTAPLQYTAQDNKLYIAGDVSVTLSQIKAQCPAAPLTLVDAATKTWELATDVILQQGAKLLLHAALDVSTLRMISQSDGQDAHVATLTAQWGTIDVDGVTVTSWDPETRAPDEDPSIPSGGAEGRSNVRAISYLDNGVARNSTLNIVSSTFQHLGYYAAEAYGIAYKARGCSRDAVDLCQKVQVFGVQTKSRFLNNYMGTYTWGAVGIAFTDNEYGHNVMYGLDPHDVSRQLTITGNRFHHNGDHGVICSQACDALLIAHNESDHNGLVPWTGPDGTGSAGQVHGIMLHRGVTNTVVEDNYVHDHPTGAGIALFDVTGTVVRNNQIERTKHGIRLSVGASDNQITGNTVTDSTEYGVFTYRGSDQPMYAETTGLPTDNAFTDNVFGKAAVSVIKLTDSVGTTFSSDQFAAGNIYLENSPDTTMDAAGIAAGTTLTLASSAETSSDLSLDGLVNPIVLTLEDRCSVRLTDASARMYAVEGVATQLTANGTSLQLDTTNFGTKPKTIRPVVIPAYWFRLPTPTLTAR